MPSRRARKKSGVLMIRISQESTHQPTVLERFRAHRLPRIASIHAGSGLLQGRLRSGQRDTAGARVPRNAPGWLEWGVIQVADNVPAWSFRNCACVPSAAKRRLGGGEGFAAHSHQASGSSATLVGTTRTGALCADRLLVNGGATDFATNG